MVRKKFPKVSVYIASSIDGYIARNDGNLDWLNYGHEGDEDYGFKNFYNSIDALILGRKTYEVVSAFEEWPYKGKRVVVLSHSLKNARDEVELFSGDISELLSKMYSEDIRHVWVDGGITASNFIKAGFVDELTISIIAMVLGSGIPLFSDNIREHKCRLITHQSYHSGLVQLKYALVKENKRAKTPVNFGHEPVVL